MPGGAVLSFTGLPGAGEATIARALHERVRNDGVSAVLLVGDVLLNGLKAGFGFSADDRRGNLRRVAHVAQLFKSEGFAAIVAMISPLRVHRELVRSIVGRGFVKVSVNTPTDVCEARDLKGR